MTMKKKHRTFWIIIFLIPVSLTLAVKKEEAVKQNSTSVANSTDDASKTKPRHSLNPTSVVNSTDDASKTKPRHSLNPTSVANGTDDASKTKPRHSSNPREYKPTFDIADDANINQTLPQNISSDGVKDLLTIVGLYLRLHKFFDFDHRRFTLTENIKNRRGADDAKDTYVSIKMVKVRYLWALPWLFALESCRSSLFNFHGAC